LYNQAFSQKLHAILQSLSDFWPETGLAILFLIVILTDLIFLRRKQEFTLYIALAGLTVISFLTWQQWHIIPAHPLFLGMLQISRITVLFKFVFLLSGILTLLLTLTHQNRVGRGEYVSVLVAIILGVHLMSMTSHLLLLYLSIELVSIGSYILTAFRNEKKSAEAGFKYLLFGAVSSGIMLYGMSWLYGFTGTLALPEILSWLNAPLVHPLPLGLAIFMTLGGLLFKIAAVPFHIWAPDAYEVAPTPVVAFFSVAPKAAAFAVLLRLFVPAASAGLVILENLEGVRTGLIAVAMLSMAVGNFSAIWQKNAKRMLAYSSIAHAGFLLAALVAGNTFGEQSLLFYVFVYLCMNFLAFLLIDLMNRNLNTEDMHAYKGIGLERPFIGVAFLFAMISLTGLPPTAGFSAKLFVFSAVWQAYQDTNSLWLLALFIFGLFNVLISLFYYLKIPFFLFFRSGSEPNSLNLGIYDKILISFLIVPVLLFFFKADWLMDLIRLAQK
jgi:NADH-quinone oxidoreductase subunit N